MHKNASFSMALRLRFLEYFLRGKVYAISKRNEHLTDNIQKSADALLKGILPIVQACVQVDRISLIR